MAVEEGMPTCDGVVIFSPRGNGGGAGDLILIFFFFAFLLCGFGNC